MTTTIAVVARTGGRCEYGPCRSAFAVSADGAWRSTENGAVVADGRVSADDVRTLEEAMERSAIVAGPLPPFTGTCPTVSDGSEVSYEFTLNARPFRASTCERRVPADDPGVRAVSGLRERVSGG